MRLETPQKPTWAELNSVSTSPESPTSTSADLVLAPDLSSFIHKTEISDLGSHFLVACHVVKQTWNALSYPNEAQR